MGLYTVTAVGSVLLVLALELLWLRTSLLRAPRFWLAMAIVLAFQVPVDGWLTRLPHPIVGYAEGAFTGWRVPWDIPVEDFLFGFSMITATLLVWHRVGRRATREGPCDGDRDELRGTTR